MNITLDWLGTATFRLVIDDRVVFLDAYMDRVPTAPPVGLSAKDVDKADFILVGHSHFDHLAGAEYIALNTGARIIGSNETCRVMREKGVAGGQLLPSQGGEHHRPSDRVTVRVFPGLHACLWAKMPRDTADEVLGDTGMCEDERTAAFATGNPFLEPMRADPEWAQMFMEHLRTSAGSRHDGGPLVYLIETPAGSIFYQDTSGCWSSVLRDLRADVAILAVSGRPNMDGEPFQGSFAQFLSMEAGWLQAKTIMFGHHDNWTGQTSGYQGWDLSPVREELRRALPGVTIVEDGYLAGTRLFV